MLHHIPISRTTAPLFRCMSLFFVPTCPVNVSRETFEDYKKGDVSRETSPTQVDQLRQSASLPVCLLFSDIFSASF